MIRCLSTWRDTEVVITERSWKPSYGNVPWVRIPLSPPKAGCGNPTACANWISVNPLHLQKYSSWWRGAPAKGVGRETGARVRVSPSAPIKAIHLLMCGFYSYGWETRTRFVHVRRFAAGGGARTYNRLFAKQMKKAQPFSSLSFCAKKVCCFNSLSFLLFSNCVPH